MRFLHVIGSVDPRDGGPLEGVLRGAEVLERWGHVREIASLDPPESPLLTSSPVTTYGLGRSNSSWKASKGLSWRRYRYSPALVPWLREHAELYDAVIVNGLWNYSAIGTWIALSRSNTPYYVFTHGQLDPWFARAYPIKTFFKRVFWYFFEYRVLRDARRVLFTTEDEKVLAEGSFKPYLGKGHVVGYGTAPPPEDEPKFHDAFRLATPELAGRPYLLFMSRIHPKKGCDILIRSFANVARVREDLHLVIAGPDELGWQGDLMALAGSLGVSDRIHWPGMLRGDAKWGAYYGAEGFVLPSHSENFGIVVAEAMGCGTPVVITDKVNIWREVDREKGGVVGTDTVESYSQALETFLRLDPTERAAMGERARQTFQAAFHIDAAVQNLIDIVVATADEAPAARNGGGA